MESVKHTSGLKNNVYITVLSIFLMLFSFNHISAQINIQVTNCMNLTGTYVDLGINGTVITTTNFDDANSSATNIGFNFSFNGLSFSQFVLNTNGFIRLGAAAPSAANLFYTGAQSYTGGPFNSIDIADQNILAVFNHDLTGGTNPEYRVYTEGTSPNRKCIIQFKNLKDKTTSPVIQFDNINFQIILYETSNIIEYIYGVFTPSINADNWKSAAVGLKASGIAANQLLVVTKGSTTPYSGATFLAGNYTGNAFNFRSSVFPISGQTLRFMPTQANDRAIMEIFTLGKAPIPFGNPQTISAWIKNSGTSFMAASTCTLNVSGANTYSNTQTLPGMAAGDSILVNFTSFSPTVTGVNTVEVSLPSDGNPFNNIKTRIIETNLNSYSYAQGSTPFGGVGFTGATGDFSAKFITNSAQSINQVNVNFSNSGQPFQIGVWSADASGAPGTLLHTTPSYTSALGVYTVLINPPVSIPSGAFFVGVRQIGTTNVSFSYQSENPIRSNTFYFTSPSGGTSWTDFAPNNLFRFMIEPKFALQTDVGITSVSPITGTTLIAGQSYDLNVSVVNYGLSAQNNIPVKYSVNGGTPKGPVNTTTSIAQNGTTSLSFTGTNAFSATTAGVYVIKVFTGLTGDLSNLNDTMTLEYQIIPPPSNTFPYSQDFSNPVNWTISGIANLWQYGIATGSSGQPNDTAAFASFFSTFAGNNAMLKSPAFDLTALSNPTLQFDVSYRTKTIENDSLQVLVSTDGGLTYIPGTPPLYLKSNSSSPSLATQTADPNDFIPSMATQWRKETIGLSQFSSASSLIIALKAYSEYGNNCWVDNFRILQGTIPTVTTVAVTGITQHTAESGGNVTNMGSTSVTARGVCWNTTQNPTTANFYTVNGSGTGSFTSTLSGMTAGTPYYVRAYATNSAGTAYGNELTFTTAAPSTIPTVITEPVSNITHFGAVSGGDVTHDGGAAVTARGVCYSILPNPTIADAFTNNGTGTGTFASTLLGLSDNTPYYLRAYATNSIGIAYGTEMSFTTLINSIEDLSENKISVYVSHHQITIESGQHRLFDNIQIIDITGAVVATYGSQQVSPTLQLPLPSLAAGAYVLTLLDKAGSTKVKIMISK